MNPTTTENKIKPGYKKTPVGVIPEDWEVNKMKEIGSFHRGRGIPKKDLIEDGLKAIRYGEIYTVHHYFVKEFYSFINEETAEKSFLLNKGDILFAGSGETLEEIGKSVAFIEDDQAYASGDIVILRPKENKYNSKFLGFITNNNVFRKQTYRAGQGQSVVHIYPSNLRKINLPIPPLPEQKAIADCLSTWDKGIEKLTALIQSKKEQKKGLMQGFFSGKLKVESGELIRAKEGEDFTEDWREVRFKDLFDRVNSKKNQITSKKYIESGVYPVVDQGKMKIVGYSNLKSKLYTNIPVIVFGDHTREIKYIDFNFIIGADGTQLLKNKYDNNIIFLYYLLKNTHIVNLGYSRHMRVLITKKFIVPNQKEQFAIAQVLTTADKEIELLEKKLATFQTQKKGLMQVLLTGEKRLIN